MKPRDHFLRNLFVGTVAVMAVSLTLGVLAVGRLS